jgi:hypothetical protein
MFELQHDRCQRLRDLVVELARDPQSLRLLPSERRDGRRSPASARSPQQLSEQRYEDDDGDER